MQVTGTLAKMIGQPTSPIQYQLPTGDTRVALNPVIGKTFSIEFSARIHCIGCGRKIKKSYNQGYCFPCTQRLAACDICIVRPEKCHYAAGTCREPDWAQTHCMQDHIIYLANTSGLKVGITRHTQIPTRWIDQGANQALPLMRVKDRFQSGLVETVCKKHLDDRTDWRKMLKGDAAELDLRRQATEIRHHVSDELAAESRLPESDYEWLIDARMTTLDYPVLEYPDKVRSLSLDKTPQITANLRGIKGQYLITDAGVLNIRKHTGYEVTLTLPD